MQNLFREIHKNSWLLKKVDAKKVLQKKSEKYWVVFCVHDDCEAFLEGFTEPRGASTHQPDWSIALQTTQHVSHALVSSEQEFEFVVTLANEIARFSAPTWELMIEWVECLRSKLREMKILSPRENLYSKLPEIRPPLLPTRDPTSPLPAPPPVAVNLIPGVERVVHPPLVASASVPTTSATAAITTLAPQPSTSTASMSNTSIQNIMNLLSNPLSAVSKALHHSSSSSSNSDGSSTISSVSSADMAATNSVATHTQTEGQSMAKTFVSNVIAELHDFPSTSGCSLFQMDANADLDCSSNESNSITIQAEPLVIPRPHTSRTSELKSKKLTTKLQKSEVPLSKPPLSEEQNGGSTNITIIQVSNIDLGTTETPKPVHNSDDYKSNVQIIPSNISPPPSEDRSISPTRPKVISIGGENSVNRVQVNNDYGKINITKPSKTVIISTTAAAPSAITTVVENSTNKTKTNISITQTPSTTHYEEVFLSTSAQPANGQLLQHPPLNSYANNIQRHNQVNSSNLVNIVNTNQSAPTTVAVASPTTRFLNKQQRSTSQPQMQMNNRLKVFQSNNVISINSGDKQNAVVAAVESPATQEPSTSTQVNSKPEVVETETAVQSANNRPVLQRGQTEVVINRTKLERTARSSRQRTANNNDVAKLRTNGDVEDSRKRSSSTSDAASNRQQTTTTAESPRRLQQPPQPYRPENTQHNPTASGRMTLREQQVFQLRREMMHPGGVRLQLRRKDCLGSIAWVEAFGGVWVAGWKQREHPVLYNALHIGDQLISIAGSPVSTPAEANKLIRAAPGLFVEMLIRRVPFGRVYAIRREMEGQCLGLIRDGNSAIIVDVVPNSLAARFGLPPKAQTCDKTSLTFWVLTEINFRPLNLFFKENEIKDRLNCVGRDISILVQPSDLVTKLKKQLKSTIKGHKDFIVQ